MKNRDKRALRSLARVLLYKVRVRWGGLEVEELPGTEEGPNPHTVF
jgi:hypothetical protein